MSLTCCPKTTNETGGVVLGGGCIYYVDGNAYTGFEMILPLDESADGTTDEYVDRTTHDLNGTGGNGTELEIVPTLDDGVFCLPSQHFDNRQYITLDTDGLTTTQEFAVSMWAKVETQFAPRTLYARDNFFFGYDFLNRPDAVIHYKITDIATDSAFAIGSTKLTKNVWYHLAASWEPEVGLKVYVNGVLNGSTAVAYPEVLEQANCFLSLTANENGYHQGNMQEVRLHGSKRSAAWFQAEFDNLCDSDFYSIG